MITITGKIDASSVSNCGYFLGIIKKKYWIAQENNIYILLYIQLSDVDTDTIQRQRRELQLLIGELKDRDRYDNYIMCQYYGMACSEILGRSFKK